MDRKKVLSASSVAASSASRRVVHLRTIAGTRVCSMTDRRAHGWLDSIPALSCTTSASIGILRISPEGGQGRKIREWTTLDWILNYTFNFPAPAAQNEVAGYAKDGGKNATMKGGKDKNVMPVSTAEYNPCGWRAWLNGTTITLGVNNVFDLAPPFVAACR